MQVSLFNSKNPNGKRIPVTITLEQIDDKNTNDGEIIYVIGLHTGAIGIDNKKVDPVYINYTSKSTYLEELSKGLSTIAEKINWGTLEEDVYPPNIITISPKNNTQNVPINSNIEVQITDPFPASFINKDTIKLKINGIDVTTQTILNEKNNQINISWIPTKITNN